MTTKRKWQEYSNEEKLLVIESYLDGMRSLENADTETQNARLQWIREHLPAYDISGDKNYLFISYSHKDFAKVYHDLAVFLYNGDTKVRFWYDEGLPAGKNWAEEARKYIEHPRCVGAIFYLSDNLLASDAVLQEMEMIKSVGKPYVSIALDKDKFSASRILKDRERNSLYEKFDAFFPDADTALIYGEDYENILYRIHKIEEAFNVTEDVLSDFVCEEYEEGLRLVKYQGNKSEIYIPERINDKPVIAINARFPNAESIFIPKTVRRIELPTQPVDTYEDVKEESTATIFRMMELMIGGYQRTGAIFGTAGNLAVIRVDDANPYFQDKHNCLYTKRGAPLTLLRVPPQVEVEDKLLEGVKKIGDGAFVGCRLCAEEVLLPDTVEELGDGAFAESGVRLTPSIEGLKKVGRSVFSETDRLLPAFDLNGEYEILPAWAFRCNKNVDVVFLPDTVQYIEKGAFFSSAINMVIATGIKGIGNGAFALCGRLDCVTLPEGLEFIGEHAFHGCESLLEIKIPASVKVIGDGAFADCSSLKYVYYEGTRQQLAQIRTSGDGPSEEFLSAIVCKDEKFRRFKTWINRKRRKRAEKILEKV